MDSNVLFPALPTYVGVPNLAGLLSLIVTVILPVLAALFMRVGWSALAKGLVLLLFAAVKAFLEAWLASADTGAHFAFGPVAYSIVVQFMLAVVAYFGLLRGTAAQRSAIQGGLVKSYPTPHGDPLV